MRERQQTKEDMTTDLSFVSEELQTSIQVVATPLEG